ncbi:sugar transporter ERD6-like 6 [Myzus persicae]|uniref:sugar transporter ERD6-like 6 n=1 Tax=Myzus persicae TaxID=13164 RepID=UPI000B939074|nr:sugar transporter ERD6-like 6 [Myzus persicae]
MSKSIVIQESVLRQIIYTILVSQCSLTVGMCLEWRNDDGETENDWSTSENMSKTLIYGGAIISAGPAALIASMQTKLREVLIIGMLFTLCGSIIVLMCSTGALSTLITGRILHGMGAGIVCVVVPNYAAEITEPKYRDVLTGLHPVFLLSGMMLSHFADDYCTYSHVNIGIIVCMTISNLIALCFIEDPPCFQLIFYENLRKSESDCKSIDVSSNSCHKLLRNRDIDKIIDLSSIFTKKQYYRPLLINICLICIQQFRGNISLMDKLQCAYGGKLPLSEMISTITGFQLISSIFCLIIVSFLGKKNVLIISGLGMTITLTLAIATLYYMKSLDGLWLPYLIVMYIIFYSIGYGPIPWILMPQICPRKSKLWTSGVTVSLYAFLNLIINQPFINNIRYMLYMSCGVDIFLLIFTVVSAIGTVFACMFIPKIKDRTPS